MRYFTPIPVRRLVCRAARPPLGLALALGLAACGGGDDGSIPGGGSSAGGAAVVAAPLVVSAGAPASLNGTLNKAAAVAQESGISNGTGSYSSTAANDFCRVATYALPDSGDGHSYDLTVVYAKSNGGVSYVSLTTNGAAPAFTARAGASPVPGVVVDVVNRRIGFSGAVLGAGGTQSATLNGSLEYITNANVADRAACG